MVSNMKRDIVQKISREIYRRFPEFSGVSPKVKAQNTSKPSAHPTYLLTFNTKVRLPDKKTMSRWVRVVADDTGKILKTTTSR